MSFLEHKNVTHRLRVCLKPVLNLRPLLCSQMTRVPRKDSERSEISAPSSLRPDMLMGASGRRRRAVPLNCYLSKRAGPSTINGATFIPLGLTTGLPIRTLANLRIITGVNRQECHALFRDPSSKPIGHSLRRALGENPTTYTAINALTCAWAPGIGTWRLGSGAQGLFATTYTGAA